MNSIDDIPKIDEIDYGNYYNDKKIEEKFRLKKEKSCDHYGHYKNCQWFIVEAKSKGKIREAIEQIGNTIRALPNKKLDFIFIVADKLDKRDSREYETRKIEGLPYRVLVNKNSNKPLFDKLTKNQIFFVQRDTIKKVNEFYQQKMLGEFNGTNT